MNKKIIGVLIGILIIIAVLIAVFVKFNSNPDNKSEKCSKNAANIVVTVNQWASIARDLGGECVNVQTIINGTDVEPHDYEAKPSDVANIEKADVLVVNGLGYDNWALKAAANTKKDIKTINIGEEMKKNEGDNPHLWFDVNSIYTYTNTLLKALEEKIGKSEELTKNWQTVTDEINVLQNRINMAQERLYDNTFVETEGVAEYLLNNLKMQNATPLGFLNAINNDSEPTIPQIDETIKTLQTGAVFFLINNKQEENDVSDQLIAAATEMGIKQVDVTEQMPVNETKLTQWLADIVESITLESGEQKENAKRIQPFSS